MKKGIRIYEADDFNTWKGDVEGVYEYVEDVNGGPVYAKADGGEMMYMYIHHTGGYKHGYFVISKTYDPRSDYALGKGGFPWACAARMKHYWDSKTKTPPAIANWEGLGTNLHKVVGIDFNSTDYNSSFQERVHEFAYSIKSV